MALHQDTIWEVRTGGNNENGGGFHNRVPGTSVDYTFQNAPQLDLTDIACAGAGVTTITSVVGGFTAEMVGNIIKFHAGANFLTEFFEIVTVNSANSVTLDRTPATGVGANGHGKVGGGQVNCDLLDSVVVPGNTIYIQNGIYAAHPAITFTDSFTRALPLTIEGYNTLRGTRPTGNNRPVIQMGGNTITFKGFTKTSNISFEGTGDPIITWVSSGGNVGPAYFFTNCKFTNLASVGSSSCIKLLYSPNNTDNLLLIDCEFLGTAGATSYGVQDKVAGNTLNVSVLNCYFHNLTRGINIVGVTSVLDVAFSIFAVCSYGVAGGGSIACRITNCTFDSISIDGFANGGEGTTFINNNFSNCVNAGINSQASVVMYNNFFGNGNNWTGGTLNPVDNNTFIAPQFVTPGSNYALQRTSGLIDRAFSMRLGV